MKPIRHPGALLFAILLFLLIVGGCGEDLPTRGPGQAVLRVHVVPPEGVGRVVPGPAGTAQAAVDYDSVRVSAFEILPDQTSILRASVTAALADTATHFQVVLSVPPAEAYLVQVEVFGAVAGSELGGLLWAGTGSVEDLVAGSSRDVEVLLGGVVPEDLSAELVGETVQLSWAPVAGALRYRVQELLDETPRTFTTTRTDTTLLFPRKHAGGAPGGEARLLTAIYRVRAEFADGPAGAYSAGVQVSVPEPIAPSAVDDLVAEMWGPTSVMLTWTAPGDDGTVGRATAYDLRFAEFLLDAETFDQGAAVPEIPLPDSAGDPEVVTVNGLEEDHTYYFALKSIDDAGMISAISNSAQGKTTDMTPPAAVYLSATAVSAQQIRLEWAAPGDNGLEGQAAAYDLRIAQIPITEENFLQMPAVAELPAPGPAGTAEEVIAGDLAPATLYYFALKTEDEEGSFSVMSNVASDTTWDVPPVPPSSFSVEAVSEAELLLSWMDEADNEDGYELERRGGEDPEFHPLQVLLGAQAGEVTYLDSDLSERTRYTYRVRAFNEVDASAWVEAAGTTMIARPQDLSAVATAYNSVGLTWSFAYTDPSGFAVERRTGDGGFAFMGYAPGDQRGYVDATVSANTTYGYCVFAYEDTLTSLWSDTVQVITPPSPAHCTVSPSAIDFGEVWVGESAVDSAIVVNEGEAALEIDIQLAGCGEEFALLSGAGPKSLAVGESLTVVVSYAPLDPGDDGCEVQIGPDCEPVGLRGSGLYGPVCVVSDTEFAFGTIEVFTWAEQIFTLGNDGNADLTGTVSLADESGMFYLDEGGGEYVLAPGGTREVTIRYAPTEVGAHACTVNMGDDCPGIAVSGAGEEVPRCEILPTVLAFPLVEVGNYADLPFSITNVGTGQLTGEVVAECENFTLLSGGGAYELGPEEVRQVVVRFQPVTGGYHACDITPGASCDTVHASGSGDLPPECTVSTQNIEFGTIFLGEEASSSFSIHNSGGGLLTGDVTEDCAYLTLTAGGGAYELAAEESVVVIVAFYPDAPGDYLCEVTTGGSCPPVMCHGVCEYADDHWWDGFGVSGPDGTVLDLLASDTQGALIAGGLFAEGEYLARWDGTTWAAIGGDYAWPYGERVDAVTEFEGNLVAAGEVWYSAKQGSGYWRVARLDPLGGWTSMGYYLVGRVHDLHVHDGQLYAAGEFEWVDDPIETYTPGVARWDGANWGPPAAEPAGPVYDLETYGGELLAAIPSGSPAGIFALRGAGVPYWDVFGSSSGSNVYALGVHGARLIAGGEFTSIGGTTARNVARFAGATWLPMDTGINGPVWCFTVYNDDLVAGGFFSEAGGLAAANIARWDGSAWSAFGSGTNGTVLALEPWGSSLYAGGEFITAGGKLSFYIARWTD